MPFPMTRSTNHSRTKHQEIIFRKQTLKHEPLRPVPFHHQHPNHDCNRKHKKGDKHILHRNPRIQPFINFIHFEYSSDIDYYLFSIYLDSSQHLQYPIRTVPMLHSYQQATWHVWHLILQNQRFFHDLFHIRSEFLL